MAYAATATPRTKVIFTPASTALLLEALDGGAGPITGSKSTAEWAALSGSVAVAKAGKPDWGDFPFSVCFDPIDPSHLALFTLLNATPPVAKLWGVGTTLPGASPEIQFNGFVNNLTLSIPNEGWVTLKGGVSITSQPTAAAATSVTPGTPAPIRGEGTVLSLYVTNAYSQIKGMRDLELNGGTISVVSGGATDGTMVNKFPGYRSAASGSFVIEYDNSETNHTALLTAFKAVNQEDKLQITLTDADSSTITLDPVIITGWDGDFAGKNKVNEVKVSFIANCDVAIVTPEA